MHGQTGALKKRKKKKTWSVIITEVGGRSHPRLPTKKQIPSERVRSKTGDSRTLLCHQNLKTFAICTRISSLFPPQRRLRVVHHLSRHMKRPSCLSSLIRTDDGKHYIEKTLFGTEKRFYLRRSVFQPRSISYEFDRQLSASPFLCETG